ncbi:hypothetical protein GE21DRAFT_9913 [Neurospora crassa]|uniref:Uncharacterized protein n=1 Tax=Neurospora crassa (strain ATCC 24698 / 74-OR23-1A / CBS 708.71 / DSM 1257 / FGSC 987) TaxID=367110 RepID=Q7S073_NEUCR|nr:hypothetical protein NCU10052 [Neurospora crassa OR74A]EAA28704.1 hypothetical protein NCU10052 [Neurospora crassa OR74A]KHE81572.1 hypothetical protein GE21DRAFT_9913 [Neurospora crassa]|eukprot:XP_957940.1 hypothetical protein NCU10052 [Neurospora crassa OR74A]
MPPTFSFRDSLDEPPHITLGRKAWQWYMARRSHRTTTERNLWRWIINEIGPGRERKDVSREHRQREGWQVPISYPPTTEGYKLLQEHIAFQFDQWFINEDHCKIPVVSSPEPEPLSVRVRKSISNILKGGSWILDDSDGDLACSTASREVTPEPCADSKHFIRTSLYPAWKAVCDFHRRDSAEVFCFDLPFDHSNLAFDIVDAMASCQCPQGKFRLVLDSSKYTDHQMIDLLTTDRSLSGDKKLIVEVTDGSVEARTTLIKQIGDLAFILDGTTNSCILQAIRDPAVHFSLTGKKGEAPRPWGILKFIVNWEDRGFYERALEATKNIPSGPARIPPKPTASPSFSVYRDLPVLKSKQGLPVPLRPSPTTKLESRPLPDEAVQSGNSNSGGCDDDRFRLLLALWLERRRPIEDIVEEICPDFELEPNDRLPEEARLELMEALLDEDFDDPSEILADFYFDTRFIYSELDVDQRWDSIGARMKNLQRTKFEGGLKGRMRGSRSATFTPHQLSNPQAFSTWDDPELIRGDELVEPLEQGGVLLENHFDRRFPDMFIDLVYDVRYRWMDPGFGQIFNPTFYFCKHGPSGSKDDMASSMPRFKHSSFDVERRPLRALKPLETTKPLSTSADIGPTQSTLSIFGPDRPGVRALSKTSSLQSQSFNPGWVHLKHRRSRSAPVICQYQIFTSVGTAAKPEKEPSCSSTTTVVKTSGQGQELLDPSRETQKADHSPGNNMFTGTHSDQRCTTP